MIYEVKFVTSALKESAKLPVDTRLRVDKAILRLSENPRQGNVRPMVGTKSWRLRVGHYRVIYDIHDKKIVILILRVGHRKNVYKK
ncbi:MAG: mRNA interferase RelE/StbE [Candidatus Saccharimonadales bacterium]|jgi:mRNA interferase RelE/StbE